MSVVRTWGVITVAAAALAVSSVSRAELAPKTLLHELRVSPVAATAIPYGLPEPAVSAFALSTNGKKHHALGAVQLVFQGEFYASIIYEVFPSHRDAVADFNATPGYPGDVISAAPSLFPSPSKTIDNSSVGISGVTCVDGDVLVLASAESPTAKTDDTAAIRVAKLAMTHLRQTRSSR